MPVRKRPVSAYFDDSESPSEVQLSKKQASKRKKKRAKTTGAEELRQLHKAFEDSAKENDELLKSKNVTKTGADESAMPELVKTTGAITQEANGHPKKDKKKKKTRGASEPMSSPQAPVEEITEQARQASVNMDKQLASFIESEPPTVDLGHNFSHPANPAGKTDSGTSEENILGKIYDKLVSLEQMRRCDDLRARYRHDIMFAALEKLSGDLFKLSGMISRDMSDGKDETASEASSATHSGRSLEQVTAGRATMERCLKHYMDSLNNATTIEEVRERGNVAVKYAQTLMSWASF